MIVNPDHTYKVLFDNKEKARYVAETGPAQLDILFTRFRLTMTTIAFFASCSGSISEHWEFPSKAIEDPDDKKPEDWDDRAQIPDPEDKKPEE